MTTLEKIALRTAETKPECLVWRRKHGRGAGLKDAARPVWTLTPVAR
ncbi:MAG: hypothetical protein FD126_1868 [Elusimicrobia bacterium]|nr:MAG: hypothetical protein FD126_1868 [Elusimicrobiota bacterium]